MPGTLVGHGGSRERPVIASLIVLASDQATERAVRTGLRRDGLDVRDTPPDSAACAHEQSALVVVVAADRVALGHEVCARVRGHSDVPLVMLCSSTSVADEVLAFAAGCDDYIRTPCADTVVRARLHARLARAGGPDQDELRLGTLRLDPWARRVMVGEREVSLTRTEFDLLLVLLETPRQVVTRERLLDRVWRGNARDDHVLEVHLSRLRAKVLDAGGPMVGEPVPGVGYRAGRVAPAGAATVPARETPRPS